MSSLNIFGIRQKQTQPPQSNTKTKELPKKQKDVRFHLLYDAAGYFEDDFWTNFFIDMSRGKCSKKITIDNSTIMLGTKRNMNIYFYADKSPKQIAHDLKPLLVDSLNILSKSDQKLSYDEIATSLEEFNLYKDENDWKRIKNKKMRDSMLDDYVLFRKKEWNLNWENTRLLQTIISNAFYFYRTHKSKDVVMENGKIANILDIEFIEETNSISNTRFDIEHISETSGFDEHSREISDVWKSYVKVLADDISIKADSKPSYIEKIEEELSNDKTTIEEEEYDTN